VLFTPYLVRHLGLDGYGLVPLANTLFAFLMPILITLTTPYCRDLTVALESQDLTKARVIFNSGIFGSIVLAFIIASAALPVVVSPLTFFRVAPGYEDDSRLLLAGSTGALLVTTLSTPFELVMFCKSRFALRNLVTMLGTGTRVGLVMVMFAFVGARPRYVGAGLFAGALVSATLAFIASRALLPDVRFAPKLVRWATFVSFLKTGAWLLIQQVGTVLFLNVDIVVVNRFIGPREAGLYSLAMFWATTLVTASAAVGSAFSPPILRAYGRGHEDFAASTTRAVRSVSLIMALPVAGVAGLAPALLRVWQGADVVHLAPLLAMLAGVHLTTLAFMPLGNVFIATDRVRTPSIAQIVAGVAKLALAIVLVRVFDLGMIGVAIAGGVLLIARSCVYNVLLASKITGVPATSYIKAALPASTVGLVSAVIMWAVAKSWIVSSWIHLGLLGLAQAVLYAAASWLVVLVPEEKIYVKSLMRRVLTPRAA